MWIVVNIGCIECGVSSNIVGAFASEDEAKAIAEKCDDVFAWREGGQNNFAVFPLPALGVIAEEYRERLAVKAAV